MLTHAQFQGLLSGDDPEPVELLDEGSRHPVLLVCEHAGRAIPKALGDLGVAVADRDSHIGWDIGAAAVTRLVAKRLGAPAVLQRYSRLVIDCNRPSDARDAIPVESAGVAVPGNLDGVDRAARVAEIFEPYHAVVTRLRQAPERRAALSIHSFTPELWGVQRPWHVGFLFRQDRRTSELLAGSLARRRGGLEIGMNEPYEIDDESDFFVPHHGEAGGIPHSLIEIRNDGIVDPQGQADWADLLCGAIDDMLEAL